MKNAFLTPLPFPFPAPTILGLLTASAMLLTLLFSLSCHYSTVNKLVGVPRSRSGTLQAPWFRAVVCLAFTVVGQMAVYRWSTTTDLEIGLAWNAVCIPAFLGLQAIARKHRLSIFSGRHS